MPRYKVGLARTCSVTIEAANEEDAKGLAEFFIVERDGSTVRDQEQFGFKIEEIELTYNDSFECEETAEAS
jgi:hypothetical protein